MTAAAPTPATPGPLPAATILGYPRLGPNRELKRAVEASWRGELDDAGLDAVAAEQRAVSHARLIAQGLPAAGGAIPESFSLYDQVLDATIALGAIPERFGDLSGLSAHDRLFALARGTAEHAPLEMTKWFDTNYHYSVPELSPGTRFAPSAAAQVAWHREAGAAGVETRPVLVGPVTYLLLAKAAAGAEGFRPLDLLDEAVAAYAALLAELSAAGVAWVQLDEPALGADTLPADRAEITAAVTAAYRTLGAAERRPRILLTTPYGDASAALGALAELPVEALHLDLVRGELPASLPELGERQLVLGLVDGRNVWRTPLRPALALAERLRDAGIGVVIGSANSLQHVPHSAARETELDPALRRWLAFADEKTAQAVLLARGLAEGAAAIEAELADTDAALAERAAAAGVRVAAVRERAAAVTDADRNRAPEGERRAAQRAALALPPLTTTTIGSFPQTAEIRRARASHGRGELATAEYEGFLREEIASVIRVQEEIGLDVLVHGEAERNDMVQYFAEHLDGFAVTRHGWVQSYGTRATRPSLLWGDVTRPAPITVGWTSYAQSLTALPVKGMLTGPVTILAWSFVRDDQPLAESAAQVALALRDEIADLVAAGTAVIQVDEPALRELLPLEAERQADYLGWAVGAFRLATGGAPAATQVHTHLCYSEFGEIVAAVDGLDADVTSIEAARSRMDVVAPLGDTGFSRGIGPGVYDIHSPRVPAVAELAELIAVAKRSLTADQLWVNPDCGLKTRGYAETVASLKNLVAAAGEHRG